MTFIQFITFIFKKLSEPEFKSLPNSEKLSTHITKLLLAMAYYEQFTTRKPLFLNACADLLQNLFQNVTSGRGIDKRISNYFYNLTLAIQDIVHPNRKDTYHTPTKTKSRKSANLPKPMEAEKLLEEMFFFSEDKGEYFKKESVALPSTPKPTHSETPAAPKTPVDTAFMTPMTRRISKLSHTLNLLTPEKKKKLFLLICNLYSHLSRGKYSDKQGVEHLFALQYRYLLITSSPKTLQLWIALAGAAQMLIHNRPGSTTKADGASSTPSASPSHAIYQLLIHKITGMTKTLMQPGPTTFNIIDSAKQINDIFSKIDFSTIDASTANVLHSCIAFINSTLSHQPIKSKPLITHPAKGAEFKKLRYHPPLGHFLNSYNLLLRDILPLVAKTLSTGTPKRLRADIKTLAEANKTLEAKVVKFQEDVDTLTADMEASEKAHKDDLFAAETESKTALDASKKIHTNLLSAEKSKSKEALASKDEKITTLTTAHKTDAEKLKSQQATIDLLTAKVGTLEVTTARLRKDKMLLVNMFNTRVKAFNQLRQRARSLQAVLDDVDDVDDHIKAITIPSKVKPIEYKTPKRSTDPTSKSRVSAIASLPLKDALPAIAETTEGPKSATRSVEAAVLVAPPAPAAPAAPPPPPASKKSGSTKRKPPSFLADIQKLGKKGGLKLKKSKRVDKSKSGKKTSGSSTAKPVGLAAQALAFLTGGGLKKRKTKKKSKRRRKTTGSLPLAGVHVLPGDEKSTGLAAGGLKKRKAKKKTKRRRKPTGSLPLTGTHVLPGDGKSTSKRKKSKPGKPAKPKPTTRTDSKKSGASGPSSTSAGDKRKRRTRRSFFITSTTAVSIGHPKTGKAKKSGGSSKSHLAAPGIHADLRGALSSHVRGRRDDIATTDSESDTTPTPKKGKESDHTVWGSPVPFKS